MRLIFVLKYETITAATCYHMAVFSPFRGRTARNTTARDLPSQMTLDFVAASPSWTFTPEGTEATFPFIRQSHE